MRNDELFNMTFIDILPYMDKEMWLEKLEKEGYKNVRIVEQPPNTDFGEHVHDEHTVHVIVMGDLIISEKGEEKILKVGDRCEFPAGTKHGAKTGSEGLTMIVGVKK